MNIPTEASKRYEILEGLPPYGPMYVCVSEDGKPFFQEGFVVRFLKSDGTTWVGNFKAGWSSLNFVFELTGTSNLIVIAQGTGYLMNPEIEKPISNFEFMFREFIGTYKGKHIFCDYCGLIVIDSNGEYWSSEDIAMDGLKDLKIDENIVSGMAANPIHGGGGEWGWKEFTYDVDTKTLIGGHKTPRAYFTKKSWWKFW